METSFAQKYGNRPDPGSEFHRFVQEYLALTTNVSLSSYLAPGKDGAIDLYDDRHQGVWECKFVGADGLDAIRPRWKEVEQHLSDNLLPGSPKSGQGQYRPWYNTTRPIQQYRFCVSARFSNHQQRETLKSEIQTVFSQLAQRSGLAHLGQIAVEVFSWDYFEPALAKHPALKVRWFGLGDNAQGLKDYSGVYARPHSGFQAYLHGESAIRYVPTIDTLTPEAVLNTLTASHGSAAAVLHGRGGVGKSRLLVEVGSVATKAGWVVLVAQSQRVTPEALTVAVQTAGNARVLVLMDYIERCAGWDAFLYQLTELAEAGAQVWLLGSCRSSHTDRLDPYQVTFIPLPSDLEGTVAGMLAQREGLSSLASACRGVPVFAAFLCFLHDRGDKAALESLRRENDFRRWLLTHITRWPVAGGAGASSSALLPELLVNVPCSEQAMAALVATRSDMASIRDALCADGWLESDIAAPDNETWSAIHDVLSDGALLQWLESTPPRTAETSVLQWLRAADHGGSLVSVLRALQRVVAEPSVHALRWYEVFVKFAANKTTPWRDAILMAGLMSAQEAIAWLEACGENTGNAVTSAVVRGVIADAIRAVQEAHPSEEIGVCHDATLRCWADAAVASLTGHTVPLPPSTSNRVLVQAFRHWPHAYATQAQLWLQDYAEQLQAQFLLNTFLKVGGKTTTVNSD